MGSSLAYLITVLQFGVECVPLPVRDVVYRCICISAVKSHDMTDDAGYHVLYHGLSAIFCMASSPFPVEGKHGIPVDN